MRFLWIIPLLLQTSDYSLPPFWVAYILALVEVLRRIIWNFFRVENEHMNNILLVRAFNVDSLPYNADLFFKEGMPEDFEDTALSSNDST